MTPISSAPPDLHTRAEEAAAVIRAAAADTPRLAVVLGSGLNELADRIADADDRPLRPDSPLSAHDRRRA